MEEPKLCRTCRTVLEPGKDSKNWYVSLQLIQDNICNECKRKRQRDKRAADPERYHELSRASDITRKRSGPRKSKMGAWFAQHGQDLDKGTRTVLAREFAKARRQAVKAEVLAHYCLGGDIVCARCGFSDIAALSLDHISGNGAEHRRTVSKTGGTQFYSWVKRNGYPENFQVLCMNCQYIKREESGECRARREVSDEDQVDESGR